MYDVESIPLKDILYELFGLRGRRHGGRRSWVGRVDLFRWGRTRSITALVIEAQTSNLTTLTRVLSMRRRDDQKAQRNADGPEPLHESDDSRCKV